MRYRQMTVFAVLGLWAACADAGAPVAPSGGAESAADASATVEAVWVERKFKFAYSARTAYFSCDGLAGKVKRILGAIGARPGYTVKPRGCFSPRRGAEWTPMLDITVASALEATPAVLEEAAKQAQQRALVARSGGAVGPVEETVMPFPAVVHRVDLRDSPTGMLRPGDCELVEQLRDQVFKPLGARIVIDRMACTYHRLDNNIIVMSLDVLEPVPDRPPTQPPGG